MRDRIFELTDVVRETGYAIHCYHGPGHLEKVYENALVHRLRKRGISVEQQKPLTVHDEDGTILGEYVADILIEGRLILEIKAAKAIIDDHIAQTLGYLRSARLEHGVIVNFGAPKFQIRKLVMSEALHQPERDGPPPLLALLFAFFSATRLLRLRRGLLNRRSACRSATRACGPASSTSRIRTDRTSLGKMV